MTSPVRNSVADKALQAALSEGSRLRRGQFRGDVEPIKAPTDQKRTKITNLHVSNFYPIL